MNNNTNNNLNGTGKIDHYHYHNSEFKRKQTYLQQQLQQAYLLWQVFFIKNKNSMN